MKELQLQQQWLLVSSLQILNAVLLLVTVYSYAVVLLLLLTFTEYSSTNKLELDQLLSAKTGVIFVRPHPCPIAA